MRCETIDWRLLRDDDCILWFRKHQYPHYWRAAAIGAEDVCRSLSAEMLKQYPRRSVLILPKHETPILELV